MEWTIALIISAICFVGSVIFAWIRAKSKYKSGRFFDPSKIMFFGIIISALILFVPIYTSTLGATECGVLETLMLSINSMMRLFILDGDFSFILGGLEGVTPFIFKIYTGFFSILFVLAPILTFSFVLSFFKNISAHKRYATHYNSEAFIFSELNDRSITLAQSLAKGGSKKRLFVFAGVDEDDDNVQDLVEKAKELGAVCFEKDITVVNFAVHSKKQELRFFTIGNDQSENVDLALSIIKRYKKRENTHLYVFSTRVESEMLLSSAFSSSGDETKIKVRLINEVQSLILRNLYEHGYEKIFKSAYDDGSGVAKINAVVLGMGEHGTEMTKALSWFCQMDGYLVSINSFDIDKYAKDKFVSKCPELMALSGNEIEYESKYSIEIHPEINVETATFDNMLLSLPRATYVFVALGNDERNISAAVKMRMLCERAGYSPVIQAVVYNTGKKEALLGVTNFKGEEYDIDFMGDAKTLCSEEVILLSDVEAQALKRHTKWGSESDFWRYNYNYKSSIASAIHRRTKSLCGIPGIDKEPKERTHDELWNIRILEHNRWNAYMRSEGYVYGGTTEPSGRKDLAKKHNCLVPFYDLPLKEQEKDDD